MIASVVICAHGRPLLLAETLGVLRAQTYLAEVVVIDDSPEPLPAYPPSVDYTHLPFDGRYHRTAKYNRGVAQSHGGVVILLDDDCLPLSDQFVATYLAGLAQAPVVRGLFQHAGVFQLPPWFSTANIGFRRDVWERVGGFDPCYDGHYGYEDVDLEQVLGRLGVAIGIGQPGTGVLHRGAPYAGVRDQTNERYYRKKWGFPPI